MARTSGDESVVVARRADRGASATTSDQTIALSNEEGRKQCSDCIRRMLHGDVQLIPVFFVILFQYLSCSDCPSSNKTDMINRVVTRGLAVIKDLTDIATEMEKETIANKVNPKIKGPPPSMLEEFEKVAVNVMLLAIGAATRVAEIRPVLMWTAGIFILIRVYESINRVARVVMPPSRFASLLTNLKWVLCVVFLGMDNPGYVSPDALLSNRRFSSFAIGFLLYRCLFTKEPHSAKVINAVVAGIDIAMPSVLSYTLLAVRLLNVNAI